MFLSRFRLRGFTVLIKGLSPSHLGEVSSPPKKSALLSDSYIPILQHQHIIYNWTHRLRNPVGFIRLCSENFTQHFLFSYRAFYKMPAPDCIICILHATYSLFSLLLLQMWQMKSLSQGSSQLCILPFFIWIHSVSCEQYHLSPICRKSWHSCYALADTITFTIWRASHNASGWLSYQ